MLHPSTPFRLLGPAACCLLLVGGLSRAMEPRPAGPAAPAERRPNRSEPLNSLLEPIRRRYDLPALAAAVIRGGEPAGIGAVGVRKAGDPIPVRAEDAFHLGSDTKAMTATLLARLIERGKLTWDTSLAQGLPDLAGEMDPAWRPVTLLQLLENRGGFPNETAPPGKTLVDLHQLPGTRREQRTAYLRMILKQKPKAKPGAEFIYSNAGYTAAGAIAERAEGTEWEALMRREIFQPLGMTTAGFGAPGRPDRVDQPWGHLFRSGIRVPVPPGPLSDNPPLIGPAGTVHCSVGDWAKFVAAHVRGARGDGGLLKAATFRKLHTPAFGGDYACGWLTAERAWGGGTVLTHAGSNTLSYCVAWLAPRRDFAVLACTNQGNDAAARACDDTAAALIARFLGGLQPGKLATE